MAVSHLAIIDWLSHQSTLSLVPILVQSKAMGAKISSSGMPKPSQSSQMVRPPSAVSCWQVVFTACRIEAASWGCSAPVQPWDQHSGRSEVPNPKARTKAVLLSYATFGKTKLWTNLSSSPRIMLWNPKSVVRFAWHRVRHKLVIQPVGKEYLMQGRMPCPSQSWSSHTRWQVIWEILELQVVLWLVPL